MNPSPLAEPPSAWRPLDRWLQDIQDTVAVFPLKTADDLPTMRGGRARADCTAVGIRLPAREMILRSKKAGCFGSCTWSRVTEWGGKGGVLGPAALFTPSFGCYG